MRRKSRLRWSFLPAGALLAALAWGATVPDARQPVERAPAASPGDADDPRANGGPGRGGLRARIDPESGRLVRQAGAAGETQAAELGAAERFSSYGGDLIEEPLADGGFKVDLRGRFQSAVKATIDPVTGEAEIDCVTATAGEEADHGH